MQVAAIQTEIFNAGENLVDFILRNAEDKIKSRSVLAVTSKIVSLAESRLVAKDSVDKRKLMLQESDHDLGEIGYGCHLTICHRLFLASAGIDESNSANDDYILLPEDPTASARALHSILCEKLNIEELGIVITDSKTQPLRKGVTGVALSYWGFKGLQDKIGESDLFGRELKMTTINNADALAAAATFLMGEGNDCRPLAIVDGAPVEFVKHNEPDEISMPVEADMYFPLYKHLISTDRV